jgi:hypothetical protein
MSMLREELERSFGDGPAPRPVEELLVAGRRALRRRRLGSAVAALGVVAVLGTTYALAAPGDDAEGKGRFVNEPTSTPSSSTTDEPAPASEPWPRGTAVRYSADGVLEVRPGVVVHEHIQNPYDYPAPQASDALDLTFQGERIWAILEITDHGLSSSEAQPSNGWASFADYVADQVTAGIGDSGWPDTLRLTDQGTVVASAGSEILQRTDDPRLGDSFAPPGTPTGAAVVRATDQVGYFVVWRVLDGQLDAITTPPRDVVGATFEELLTYARGKYASGEGLR